jgi:F-type H+-transporting ATPase subunit b
MNFNATLIGQSITFMVFVWFCMKFVWPPIMHALQQRKEKVAEGLAAGERGRHELELAQKKALETMHEAKQKAAQLELEREVNRAKETLRGQVVEIATAGAGRILKRELDATANDELIKDLVAQI